MKVILTQDVAGFGQAGDVKETKSGYARNFLIPNGLATFYSPALAKETEAQKKREEAGSAQMREAQLEMAKKIDGKLITIHAKTSEKGKLFGSITALQIVKNLAEEHDIVVTAKQVKMPVIKEMGEYEAEISLAENINAKIKIKVI